MLPNPRLHEVGRVARQAVILVAGAGRRLRIEIPKCLVALGGVSLLEHQVRALAVAGVTLVTVVVGFRQELVRAECQRLGRELGIEFRFIENPDFVASNTIYSLFLARRAVMGNDFFYLNGDVLFAPDLVDDLQRTPAANALLVEVKPCGEEEVKVVTAGGRIVRIGKALEPAECLGEFVGVARFAREVGPAFSAALEQLVEGEGRRMDFFELALDRIVGGVELTVVSTRDRPVIEIDFPEDLARAQREILPRILAGAGT